MRATERGLALARKLGPVVGFSTQINSICSLICRNIASWHTLAEKLLDGPADTHLARPDGVDSPQLMRQQSRIEQRLQTLVSSLPETGCGPLRLELSRERPGNGLLLLPDGCTCVVPDDGHGRGLLIP